MTPLGCLWSLAIAATPPPTGLETDLDRIDATPEAPEQLEATRLEDRLLRLARPDQPVSLAIGDTVFLETELNLDAPPQPRAIVSSFKSSKPGLLVLPVVTLEDQSSGKKRKVLLRYSVRNTGLVGTAKLELRLQVSLQFSKNEAGAAIQDVALLLNGQLATPTLADVEDDKRAFLLFQARAEEAYRGLPTLHDYLRLDRVDRPPTAAGLKSEQRPLLERFIGARLYADIALARLRAAADHPDPTLADAAVLALGSLSKKPNSVAKKARAIEGLTNLQALDAIRAALLDLRIDEAEGFLDKLRNSGRLNRAELTAGLELEAGIHAMRGRRELARVALGRSLCLEPGRTSTLDRPFFQRLAEEAKSGGCTQALRIIQTQAERQVTTDGPKVSVVSTFGPDPFRLVSGGEIQIWGSGGEVHSAEKIRTSEDGTRLEAEFSDNGELENYAGQVLVKVVLRDLSGVPIATFGDPDPQPLDLSGEGGGGLGLPWYGWAIAGGVLVVGAATAGIIIAASQGETRGIGPVDVTF